ncbi:MAG: AsmA family protein [Candidatus Omnitrophica bacterium]|nr:AsmA family protein [Candidatus Omnitrophota bacterium]
MKKFIIIALILLLLVFAGAVYLNAFFLPGKIKSIIVSTLAQKTGKNVTLRSVEFNIFKGLVLRDLSISDNQQVIVSARQANCVIFIWPVFKKKIIIPSISLKSPYIFLERRKDGSFNLQDIFASGPALVKLPEAKESKSGNSQFSVSVYRINISSGTIVFQDDTPAVQFKKEINNIQLSVGLALPVSVKFNFKGDLVNNSAPSAPAAGSVYAWGEYRILGRKLSANLSANNLLPADFKPYYGNLGLDLLSGTVDAQAKINLREQVLHIETTAKAAKLIFAKNKVTASLNLGLETKVNYNLQSKKVSFDGNCDIRQADISGLDFFGELKNLYGKISFNERSLVAQGLKAEVLGIPFEVNLGIKDFNTWALNISTNLSLSFLPEIAKEKFNFTNVNSALGKAELFVKLHPDGKGGWAIQGKVDIAEAGLKFSRQDVPVENIFATFEFSQQGFSWSETRFKYQGVDYQSSGELSDFSAPKVRMQLSSRSLSVATVFEIVGKKIKITQAKGKYLNSQFLISGDIDNSDPAAPQVDVDGKVNLDLGDLSAAWEKKYPAIKNMQPKGQLDAQFNLNGRVHDIKSCSIQAKLSSNNISLHGLSASQFMLDYLQEQKIARVTSIGAVFYDGTINGSASLNLDSDNLPYHIELAAEGVRLEKLKQDTSSRNKNISGVLRGEIKLNGFSGDLNKLSGSGDFSVKEGRLWELNLLQGVGKLLFAKDLASIELSECACAFLVKSGFAYTDNLKLKGNVAELAGPFKIGFNGSLDAALEVDILSEMVPLSGTLKDITTAFMGKVGKIGVIKLSGSLSEPKYSFRPAVTNIIKGLTDVFFGKKPQ